MAKAKKPKKLTRKQKTVLKKVLDQVLSDPTALSAVIADPRAALLNAGMEAAEIDDVLAYIADMRASLSDLSAAAARSTWWAG